MPGLSPQALPDRPVVTGSCGSLSAPSAYLFDLDGVLTPTAQIHQRAWKRAFDEFFAHLAWNGRRDIAPLSDDDYFRYIDGRPRYEGVRAVLASRGLTLPSRTGGSGAGFDTVEGLGDLKNEQFHRELVENPIAPFLGVIELLDRTESLPRAVVSSSANARTVLQSAGLLGRFPVIVDAQVADREALPGKPAPDTFLYAASALGVPPEECCVIEDAVSGVNAGRAGGFGLVVGVDRGAGAQQLINHGAHLVVTELDQLLADDVT